MKIVELKLDDLKNGEGITAISLVKHPAIEQNWIAFSKGGVEAKPNKAYSFKTIDEDQRIIAGPAMIPDKLIYRKEEGDDGDESFVFFTGSTIRELSERFLLQGKQNNMTLEHQATLNDLSVVESWIVEDPKRDKSAMYGFDLPIGSWFVKVKVLNNDVWELVNRGDVAGFSVEGVFTRQIIENSKQEMKKTKLDGYLDKIKNLFSDETTEETTEQTTEETTEQTAEKFGTVEAEGADGAIVISFPGEALEAGVAITTTVDDAEVSVPTGEYTLSDGTVLVVVEEGIVGELRAVEEAAEENPEDMDAEKGGLKDEQIGALIDGIAEIISKFQVDTAKRMDDAITEAVSSLRVEFNKPAATVEDKTPEDTETSKIVKGLNKFVTEANKK